eukprot:3406413-Pleurochrysis_carterae.AAC.2
MNCWIAIREAFVLSKVDDAAYQVVRRRRRLRRNGDTHVGDDGGDELEVATCKRTGKAFSALSMQS